MSKLSVQVRSDRGGGVVAYALTDQRIVAAGSSEDSREEALQELCQHLLEKLETLEKLRK